MKIMINFYTCKWNANNQHYSFMHYAHIHIAYTYLKHKHMHIYTYVNIKNMHKYIHPISQISSKLH